MARRAALPTQQDDTQRLADTTTTATPPLAYPAGDDDQAVGLREAGKRSAGLLYRVGGFAREAGAHPRGGTRSLDGWQRRAVTQTGSG